MLEHKFPGMRSSVTLYAYSSKVKKSQMQGLITVPLPLSASSILPLARPIEATTV